MNSSLLKRRMAVRAGCALAAVAVAALFLQLAYAGGDVKAVATPAKTAGLSGADLYALNCNRCHAERYPKEFQASQWTTIMLHMRVRANIPASQAKEILKYLQEQSGN